MSNKDNEIKICEYGYEDGDGEICEYHRYEHGPLHICEHYSEEKKEIIKKKSEEWKKNLMDENSELSKSMPPIVRDIQMLFCGITPDDSTLKK